MPVGQPKMGRSWWRDLTECGPLEKGMANHFIILAWKIPGTEEPGGLQSMEFKKSWTQLNDQSPCLFNLYAEYIMRNAGLEEAQAGIKIAGRNINNLRYADDTTLMAESEEELKSL